MVEIHREPKEDCILLKRHEITGEENCRGLQAMLYMTSLYPCPFYKSNKDYYPDGRPRKE